MGPPTSDRPPVALRLTVVIVAYGGDPVPTLDALAAQREPGDEVVVVDNLAAAGGTPGVRGHPAVDRLLEPRRNLGFAAGCNAGARGAGGDAVLLLNPDAVPAPGCLAALRRPPEDWAAWMGVVTLPGGERLNASGGRAHLLGFGWVAGYEEPVAALPPEPYPVGFLSGACLAVRRAAWERAGGLSEGFFMYLEDVDLSHRLRLGGLAFGALPAARVEHDYAFAKGGAKWRALERNRWATVLRTYPAPLLGAVLPAMLCLELPLAAYAAAGGWLGAKVRAWGDVLRWLPRAPAERRAVQAGARVGWRAFAAGLTVELDTPLLGPAGFRRLAGMPLRAYWRVARAVLERVA